MLRTATVLFALTAGGGLLLAGVRFFTNREPPSLIAMGHGFIAASAITLLLYAFATVGLPSLAVWALVLFLIASLGGVVLNLKYHMNHVRLPKWLIGVHASAAVAGFLLLVAASWMTPIA